MKVEVMRKIEGLDDMWIWVRNVNGCLIQRQPLIFQVQEIKHVINLVTKVCDGIKDDYSFYADELPQIIRNTFSQMGGNIYSLNFAAFGELFLIIKHLHSEPQDVAVWTMIHPRIVGIAKEEYLDGHYTSAANRSFVEVETRLRELFKELKPGVTIPAKVGNLIGALLSENGIYHFCDLSTQSGKDYRKGIQFLFEGSIAAYRNPSSHENKQLTKEEAFEQIMLASQLMKVLDN